MQLVVDRESGEPVYGQIARQLRSEIAVGAVAAGASLPSVRQLAAQLAVNINTVARAYRLLRADGFVRIHSRLGVTVASPLPRPDGERCRRLREDLHQVLGCLRQAGARPRELRRIFNEEIARLSEPT